VTRPPAATELVATLEVPRSNGELVFAAPWESRAFGMAIALHEQGGYEWEAFRERLVAEIAAHPGEDGPVYYERWLASFERLVVERGLVDEGALTRRIAELVHADAHDHPHNH
jgi:nitrile hydratase accessory protein